MGKGEGIRIPFWGSFGVKPFKRKILDKRNLEQSLLSEEDRAKNKREYIQGSPWKRRKAQEANPDKEECNNKD